MKGREKEIERRGRELEKKAREQADQREHFSVICDKWHISHKCALISLHPYPSLLPMMLYILNAGEEA